MTRPEADGELSCACPTDVGTSWEDCLDRDALQEGQLESEACCFAEADLLSKPVAVSAGGSTELDLETWCLPSHKGLSTVKCYQVQGAQLSSNSLQ